MTISFYSNLLDLHALRRGYYLLHMLTLIFLHGTISIDNTMVQGSNFSFSPNFSRFYNLVLGTVLLKVTILLEAK